MDEIQKKREAARAAVRVWLNAELYNYTDQQPKADVHDINHTVWVPETYEWWEQLVLNYIGRAGTLGNTALGTQARLKALTVLFEMCVTEIVSGAPLPVPGVASGDIEIMDGIEFLRADR